MADLSVPPNNPISACVATSVPGYRSFPKWAILPGKKDKVSVNVESDKEGRQKRLLLVNLREAHAFFKEGLKLKVGFSKFVSLRPPQVLPMTLCDQEVCMCKYH